MEFCVSFFRNGLILCKTLHHLWAHFQSVVTLFSALHAGVFEVTCCCRSSEHSSLGPAPWDLSVSSGARGQELGCVLVYEWTVLGVPRTVRRRPSLCYGERSAARDGEARWLRTVLLGQAGGPASGFQTETACSSWLLHLSFPLRNQRAREWKRISDFVPFIVCKLIHLLHCPSQRRLAFSAFSSIILKRESRSDAAFSQGLWVKLAVCGPGSSSSSFLAL